MAKPDLYRRPHDREVQTVERRFAKGKIELGIGDRRTNGSDDFEQFAMSQQQALRRSRRFSGWADRPVSVTNGVQLCMRREILHHDPAGADFTAVTNDNRPEHEGARTERDMVADHRETRTSADVLVGSSAANTALTPDGAVRTEAPEDLRGDRMNQQQAGPDFAEWRNVRTGQEQV